MRKPNLLVRMTALLIVPCLLMDPAVAHAFALPSSQDPSLGGAFNTIPSSLFTQQALQSRVLSIRAALDTPCARAFQHIVLGLFGFLPLNLQIPDYARMSFGERLRLIRHNRHLGIRNVPGVDQGQLSRIENHSQIPREELLERLAQAYGESEDILLTGVPQRFFGQWLTIFRKEHKLSPDDLANLLGLSPIRLVLMESEKLQPTREDLVAYARMYRRHFGPNDSPDRQEILNSPDSFQAVSATLQKAHESQQALKGWQKPWENPQPGVTIEIPYRPEQWMEAIVEHLSVLQQAKETLENFVTPISESELAILNQMAGWTDAINPKTLNAYITDGLRLLEVALSLASDAYDIPLIHFAREVGQEEHWMTTRARGRGPRPTLDWARDMAKATRQLGQNKLLPSAILRSVARENWYRLQTQNDKALGRIIQVRRENLRLTDGRRMSQKALSQKSDASLQTIRQTEEGTYAARNRRMIEKLATALETSYEELSAPLSEHLEEEARLKAELLLMAQRAIQRMEERRRQEKWNASRLGRHLGRHPLWLHNRLLIGGATRFNLNLIQKLSEAGLDVQDLWPLKDLFRVQFKPAASAAAGTVDAPQNHTIMTTREYRQGGMKAVELTPAHQSQMAATRERLRQDHEAVLGSVLDVVDKTIVRGLHAIAHFVDGKITQDQVASDHVVADLMTTYHEMLHAKLYQKRGPPTHLQELAEEIAISYKELEYFFRLTPAEQIAYRIYLEAQKDTVHPERYLALIESLRPADWLKDREMILARVADYVRPGAPVNLALVNAFIDELSPRPLNSAPASWHTSPVPKAEGLTRAEVKQWLETNVPEGYQQGILGIFVALANPAPISWFDPLGVVGAMAKAIFHLYRNSSKQQRFDVYVTNLFGSGPGVYVDPVKGDRDALSAEHGLPGENSGKLLSFPAEHTLPENFELADALVDALYDLRYGIGEDAEGNEYSGKEVRFFRLVEFIVDEASDAREGRLRVTIDQNDKLIVISADSADPIRGELWNLYLMVQEDHDEWDVHWEEDRGVCRLGLHLPEPFYSRTKGILQVIAGKGPNHQIPPAAAAQGTIVFSSEDMKEGNFEDLRRVETLFMGNLSDETYRIYSTGRWSGTLGLDNRLTPDWSDVNDTRELLIGELITNAFYGILHAVGEARYLAEANVHLTVEILENPTGQQFLRLTIEQPYFKGEDWLGLQQQRAQGRGLGFRTFKEFCNRTPALLRYSRTVGQPGLTTELYAKLPAAVRGPGFGTTPSIRNGSVSSSLFDAVNPFGALDRIFNRMHEPESVHARFGDKEIGIPSGTGGSQSTEQRQNTSPAAPESASVGTVSPQPTGIEAAPGTIDFNMNSAARVANEMKKRIPELDALPFEERVDIVNEIRERALIFDDLGRIERLRNALGVSAEQVPLRLKDAGFTAWTVTTTQRLSYLSDQIMESLERPEDSLNRWVVSQVLLSSFCDLLAASPVWLRLVRAELGASSVGNVKQMLRDVLVQPRKMGDILWRAWRKDLIAVTASLIQGHSDIDLAEGRPGEFVQSEVSGAILEFLGAESHLKLAECFRISEGQTVKSKDVDKMIVSPQQRGDYAFVVSVSAEIKGKLKKYLVEASTKPEFNKMTLQDFRNRSILYRDVSPKYLPKPLMSGEMIIPGDHGDRTMALTVHELLENYRPLQVVIREGKVWLRMGVAVKGQTEQLYEPGDRPDIWQAIGRIMGTYAINRRQVTIDSFDMGRADFSIKFPSDETVVKLFSVRTLTERGDRIEAIAIQLRTALLPRFVDHNDNVIKTLALPDFVPALRGFYEGVRDQWQKLGEPPQRLPSLMAEVCQRALQDLSVENPTDADLAPRVTSFLTNYENSNRWNDAGPLIEPPVTAAKFPGERLFGNQLNYQIEGDLVVPAAGKGFRMVGVLLRQFSNIKRVVLIDWNYPVPPKMASDEQFMGDWMARSLSPELRDVEFHKLLTEFNGQLGGVILNSQVDSSGMVATLDLGENRHLEVNMLSQDYYSYWPETPHAVTYVKYPGPAGRLSYDVTFWVKAITGTARGGYIIIQRASLPDFIREHLRQWGIRLVYAPEGFNIKKLQPGRFGHNIEEPIVLQRQPPTIDLPAGTADPSNINPLMPALIPVFLSLPRAAWSFLWDWSAIHPWLPMLAILPVTAGVLYVAHRLLNRTEPARLVSRFLEQSG